MPSALQSVYTRIASYWEMEPAGTGGARYHRVQIIDVLFHVKSAVNLPYHLVVFQPHTTTQTIRAPDRSPAASLVLPPTVGVEWCGRCVWLCARAHGSRVPSTSVVWTWFACDVLLSMIGVPSAHTRLCTCPCVVLCSRPQTLWRSTVRLLHPASAFFIRVACDRVACDLSLCPSCYLYSTTRHFSFLSSIAFSFCLSC